METAPKQKEGHDVVPAHPTEPECEACGILAGESHDYKELTKYRGRAMCLGCIHSWELEERMFKQRVSWEYFVTKNERYLKEKEAIIEKSN